MIHPITDNHDLEDHIEDLRKLDKLRKQSGKLRDEGIEAIMEYFQPFEQDEIQPVFGEWRRERALVVRALLTLRSQPFIEPDKEEKRRNLIKSLINQIGNDFKLKEDLAENELSVLVAASVLRALIAQPGAALSKTAMLCYYWIIRELYSTDRSNWSIGGARAAPNGWATAFTTGECIRALLSFTEAMRNTGKFIENVSDYYTRKQQLNVINSRYFPDYPDPEPLKEWVTVEQERLKLSCTLSLNRFSRYLILPFHIFSETREAKDDKGKECEGDFQKILSEDFNFFIDALKGDIERNNGIKEQFSNAIEDIEEYRREEYSGIQDNKDEGLNSCEECPYGPLRELWGASSDESRLKTLKKKAAVAKSESAHMIAILAVQDALKRVKNASEILENEEGNKEKLEKIKREFDGAADEIDRLLYPVRNYLSSVLDRELALVSLGENWDWQPSELACAAASYGKLTKEWKKDSRFGRAVNNLSKVISSRGCFANPRPYHERPNGARDKFGNAVVIHAMAQLLHYVRDYEIESGLADKILPSLAEKMLRFFEDTRAISPRKAWLFSIMDINKPEMILKQIEEEINELPQKMKTRFQAFITIKDLKDLPKPVKEIIVEQLVNMLNELLQADFIREEKWFKEGIEDEWFNQINSNKKLNKDEIDPSLLIRLYLEEKFADGINRSFSKKFLNGKQEIDLKRMAENASSDKKGWTWEFSKQPLKINLTATAVAVLALAKINKMLDARINRMILDHFSVKEKNKGLDDKLTLDSLFYPDYGLRLAPNEHTFATERPDWIEEKDWPTGGINRRKSVAITLQQMRAHISRVSLPKEYKSLCSLVLHGPAGTGKTTLVEGLAVACDVPLVEVTPSDLVKRGQENIEQRARAVFEALSLLTRAVILFDEFDPVLKRRDVATNNPLSVFTFLTPGMLPKLKMLHDQAKKRSVAYVLVTNLIGELDEAAVRQGRFDERIGIYPPDLLSRVGRFLDQIYNDYELTDKESGTIEFDKVPWDRIVPIIKKTEGKGMTTLGKPGWFTIPNKKKKREELKKEPDNLYHLLHFNVEMSGTTVEDLIDKFEWPAPDDEYRGILGNGRTAVRESLEWTWIDTWDKKRFPKEAKTLEELEKALKDSHSLTVLPQPKYVKSSQSSNQSFHIQF